MTVVIFGSCALVAARSQATASNRADSPPANYFGRDAPPLLVRVDVCRNGEGLTVAPGDPGYEGIVQAGIASLQRLASVEGRVPLPSGVTEAYPANAVQFIYRSPMTPPVFAFRTAFGDVTLDRVFLLLNPPVKGPSELWASSADHGWIVLTSEQDGADLRAAVAAAVTGRRDWGRLPLAADLPITAAPTPTQ
ncbi:MAG TPA: hypothetical protein VM536_07395 [Chloroflexia bacterium]|nr:hypothetical protein [Chloroflexia bacterium]